MAYIALSIKSVRVSADKGFRVVEIAGIEMRDGEPTGENFHRYINPDIEVEESALKIHGLSSAMLADKPLFSEIAPYFCDFIRGRAVIAYKLDQVAALEREFVHLMGRLLPPWKARGWDLDEQCSLQSLAMLARVVEVPDDELEAICAHYDIEPPKSPGAEDEAKCVGAVYAAMEPDLVAWEREHGELVISDPDN
ncbi:exonuclease domain-containing protein [Nitrococcus mobilis]|nr:exonuclease domain-containing protein [Nitrococcus mobilis]